MSENAELQEEAEKIRRDLIGLMTDLRALDMRVQDVVNRQASIKAAVMLSLDHLDVVDRRLRKP